MKFNHFDTISIIKFQFLKFSSESVVSVCCCLIVKAPWQQWQSHRLGKLFTASCFNKLFFILFCRIRAYIWHALSANRKNVWQDLTYFCKNTKALFIIKLPENVKKNIIKIFTKNVTKKFWEALWMKRFPFLRLC